MTRPLLVLDTNVILDAWVFEDPVAVALGQAVEAGRVRWLTTDPMLQELTSVLRRPPQPRWRLNFERALTCDFASRAQVVDPPAVGTPQRLICTDPDDQKFIDLAMAWPATALLTHDRALLRLARRAGAAGVRVATPQAWLRGALG